MKESQYELLNLIVCSAPYAESLDLHTNSDTNNTNSKVGEPEKNMSDLGV